MTPDPAEAPKVYRLLVQVNNAAADVVLLRAFPRLERPYRRAALEVLTSRRRPGALLEMVSAAADYPDSLQAEVLAHLRVLEPALREAIEHEDRGRRLAAVKLIARSGDAKLAYLLNAALAKACPVTREAAGQAWLRLAERYLSRRSRVRGPELALPLQSERHHLGVALAQALQCWEAHRRTEILTAAAWLVELVEPALADKVAQPRSRLAHGLNGLLTLRPDPRLAAYAWRALAVPALRAQAARTISTCQDDAFMDALIDEAWVLQDPRIRRGCNAIRELRWLERSMDPLLRLSKERSACALRFVGAIGMPTEAKVRLLSEVAASGDAYLQRAAVWQLIGLDAESASQALRTLVRRGPGPVSKLARHELYRRRPAGTARTVRSAPSAAAAAADVRSLVRVARSSPPRRANVGGPPGRAGPCDAAWGFDHGPGSLLADASGTVPPDAEERARLLQILRQTDQVGEVQDQVYRLANDPDAWVRSSAVAALARIPTPTAVRILRRALDDPDERVQANAIEALDLLEVQRFDKWIESKLESPCSRVRANAVKALLKCEVQRAAAVLVEMLESDVRGERLSALWVVERLHLESLVHRVRRLAENDRDETVRRRAAAIVQALTGERTADLGVGGP